MRKLLVVWDPQSPLSRVGAVISALKTMAQVRELTFHEVGHRTMPNGSFQLRPTIEQWQPDALFWVEGGPFPSDLHECPCRRVCWLHHSALEPTLLNDIGPQFDRCLVTSLNQTANGSCHWLPLASSGKEPDRAQPGITLAIADPKPPSHARFQMMLQSVLRKLPTPALPVAVCLGLAGEAHEMLFDQMKSGSAVLVDPETDLRGLAHDGDHVLTVPSGSEFIPFFEQLIKDSTRLERVIARGPGIVDHLHKPECRAAQLIEAIWPTGRVLSGSTFRPKVSVLVACYRYAKRLRVCLESLARQQIEAGSIEIVVADPQSPDQLPGLLEEFAARHPHLRLIHLPLPSRYARNRGFCINRAFDASSGSVIISIDADIVFPPLMVRELADLSVREPQHVLGVWRVFLSEGQTRRILEGQSDAIAQWPSLSTANQKFDLDDHCGVLGYCQVVQRKAFALARYPEEFDMVNQSDVVFVERLARHANVRPRFLADQRVLHLWHPRNWSGTTEFL